MTPQGFEYGKDQGAGTPNGNKKKVMEKEKNIQQNFIGEGIEDRLQPSEIELLTDDTDREADKRLLQEYIKNGLLEFVDTFARLAQEPVRVELDMRGDTSEIRVFASKKGIFRIVTTLCIKSTEVYAIPTLHEGKPCCIIEKRVKNKTIS